MKPDGGEFPIAAARSPRNGLMVAFAFTLPYHVMRSAAAAGMRVYVLGAGAARGLRASRCCRAYHQTQFAGDPDILLAEIGELVRRHAIDIVFPADDVSTRLLATLNERLPARCIPLPDPAVFDLLNDKWHFTRFCAENGIRAPEGHLYETLHGLRRALAGGQLALPITVKPVSPSGGVGVRHIRAPDELDQLDMVDYRPILVQHHVVGDPVGITIQCDRGRVLAHVAQRRDAVRFRIIADTDLLDNVTWLATLTRYHGAAHFDAVLSRDDRRAYLVACKPWFCRSIHLLTIAGRNVFDLALGTTTTTPPPAPLEDGEIGLSVRATLTRPWRAGRLDWKFVRYGLGDPLAFALLRSRAYADSESAAFAAPMTTGAPFPGSRSFDASLFFTG